MNWDFVQSCFFCLTILTTIGMTQFLLTISISNSFEGYGNFATSTFGGRLFCLIFGIIGIPFMLSVLADVGGLMAEGIQYAWETNKHTLRHWAEKLKLVEPRFNIEYHQMMTMLI